MTVALAIIGGAIWRRWLGMAEENRHMRRPFIIAIGAAFALLVIALPAWNLWAIPIAVAPVVWLTLPAEASNFWMSDLISKAPWRWPHVRWLMTETAGPRPWAELFVGALGFGVATVIAQLL